MSAPQGTTAPARPALSARNKAGLILAILLALAELAGALQGPASKPGTDGPPTPVLYGGAVLGLIIVTAAIYMWLSRNRIGGRIVAGALIMSATPSVGAFVLSSVPAPVTVLLAALVVVAIVAVMVVLTPPKPAVPRTK
jgi:hypothetical protein